MAKAGRIKKNTKKYDPKAEDPMRNRTIWDSLSEETKAKMVDQWPQLKTL